MLYTDGTNRICELGISMLTPVDVQIIGFEIAIRWSDGRETYYKAGRLRAASPSAETQGERDIFGQQHGGEAPREFPGVVVTGWEQIGNYALRFDFSDGHRTGLYAYEYLLRLADV
jgi:DUF971 family protein